MQARLVLIIALVGCDGGGAAPDATPPPDAAPPPDLSCVGAPLPTTATDPLVITGQAFEASPLGQTALEGAVIEAFPTGGGAALFRANSGATGDFTLTIANAAMTPVDGYLRGTAPSFLDIYLYPPAPLAIDNDDALMLFVTESTLGQIAFSAGVNHSPALGFLGVLVQDCVGNPIPDAIVTVTPTSAEPATRVIYVTPNNFPDPDATATRANGLAYVFNVPLGTVTVDAEIDGVSLREHAVPVRADAINTTAVAAGPID